MIHANKTKHKFKSKLRQYNNDINKSEKSKRSGDTFKRDERAKFRLIKIQNITAELHELKFELLQCEFERKNLKSKLDKTKRNEQIDSIEKLSMT